MTRLAIVGPTASGKSRLCALLAERGAEVIEADRVGHEVLELPAVTAQVVAAFGADILGTDGRIDRKILGPRVFAATEARARLDAITHPPLAAALCARLDKAKARLVILEAAVYFLLPGPPPVDRVVAVVASAAIREQRLLAAGLAPGQARARIAAQAHLEPTWSRADLIIHNEGDVAVLADAARVLGGTS